MPDTSAGTREKKHQPFEYDLDDPREDVKPYEEIYRRQADRHTDVLIAERVLGWTPRGPHPIFGTPVYATGTGDGLLPPFSCEIHEALRLWDLLAVAGWQCSLVHKPFERHEDDRWVFHGVRLIDGRRIASFSAHAGTRELAIARGALATVNGRTEAR